MIILEKFCVIFTYFRTVFQFFCQLFIILRNPRILQMIIKNSQQRILIQQIFGWIFGLHIHLISQKQLVKFIKFQKLFQAASHSILKLVFQCCFVKFFMESQVCKQCSSRQNCIHRCLCTIVQPRCTEHFRNFIFLTGGKCHFRTGKASGIVRRNPVPDPASACKYDFIGKLFMYIEHFFINFCVRIIIVPVYQTKFRSRFLPVTAIGVFRYFVVTFSGIGSDVHVTPDHRLQSQLATDFQNSRTVLFDQFRTVFIAIFFQIISQSKLHCLVHSQMDFSCMEAVFYCCQKLLNELISLFFSYLQNVRRIHNFLCFRPFQGIMKVRQCLNTWNQFYPKYLRIFIDLSDFFSAVSSSVNAKIRKLRHFIRVFCIK